MPRFRRYAAAVAVFAAVLYAALLVAVFGVISLFSDTDVITGPGTGVLVGPVAAAAAICTVIGCLLAIGLRIPEPHQRIGLLRAFLVGVAAYLAFAVFGALAVLFGPGDAVLALIFLGRALTGVFAMSAGILAAITALLYMLVLASRVRDRGRPEWPWEKKEDGDA